MKLRHIEVFHAVYTTGSVSKAARQLNVSQPAATNLLRHAEDLLGFPLCPSSRHLAQIGAWISGERASSGG